MISDIADIRSSVIVCNHLSYLDPLLLIALLDRAKDHCQTGLFHHAHLWLGAPHRRLSSGQRPPGRFAGLMLAQMENMGAYLAEGGNLFIFPEGTRSRDGSIGALNQGALKIARYCRAPVYVLCLQEYRQAVHSR